VASLVVHLQLSPALPNESTKNRPARQPDNCLRILTMEERWNPASTSKIRSEPQEVLHPQLI
jgi:hypothetical protein